jgi:RNA polymerase sigma-70 factor (ECF subfamily)
MSAGKAKEDPNRPGLDAAQPSSEVTAPRTSLADLARNHHRALVGFLRARTGSREDARDLAQDAYAKMLALDNPNTVGFVAGYLWTIASNLAIDGRRRQAREARFAALAQGEPAKREPSPESHLYNQQRLELLEQAINTLPPRVHEAFSLRVFEERSFDEIARQMNITREWASKLVSQALKICQEHLDAAEASRDGQNDRS